MMLLAGTEACHNRRGSSHPTRRTRQALQSGVSIGIWIKMVVRESWRDVARAGEVGLRRGNEVIWCDDGWS
jgi:hypothetical protein